MGDFDPWLWFVNSRGALQKSATACLPIVLSWTQIRQGLSGLVPDLSLLGGCRPSLQLGDDLTKPSDHLRLLVWLLANVADLSLDRHVTYARRRTNSLEFTAWLSARTAVEFEQFSGTWRRICSLDIRSVSALQTLRNCALQIDIYLLTYLFLLCDHTDWASPVGLCMQDYKSLCTAVTICATFVDIHTHTPSHTYIVRLYA